jgi:hypothetical protein
MPPRAGRVQPGWKEPHAASSVATKKVADRRPQWWSVEEASPILSASICTHCNNVGVCRGILPASITALSQQ